MPFLSQEKTLARLSESVPSFVDQLAKIREDKRYTDWANAKLWPRQFLESPTAASDLHRSGYSGPHR